MILKLEYNNHDKAIKCILNSSVDKIIANYNFNTMIKVD